MKYFLTLFLIAITFVSAADTQSFTPELYKQFVELRVGAGEPVYWYCVGEIYEYPSGKLIAKVEGVDTARLIKSESSAAKSLQLLLNFPNYQAYENYDFFRYPKAAKGVPQSQLSWNRRGNLPPFFGGGDSVFQLASHRVDKYSDLPLSLREVLEREARLWMSPPKDLKEIEELQKP